MTEEEMRAMIEEALYAAANDGIIDEEPRINSYEEAGMLTMNEGMVIRVGDSEFQITIVKSR